MTEEKQEITNSEIEVPDSSQGSVVGNQGTEKTMEDGRLMMDESSLVPPLSSIVTETTENEVVEAVEQQSSDDAPNQAPVESPSEVTLESVIEAVLFASDEALTPARLAGIVEITTKQVNELVKQLNEKYQSNNSAFRIEQIAGGYQMLTLNCYNPWLKQLLRARSESKFSPAALETLAIIAYKQPIMRADIEAIRGVAVGEVIRSLSYKGLVKIVGRAEVLGRPMLYGTTKTFLEVFGLNSLKDLPKIEELKKPAQ
jgi:segregation and condensation protein B